MKINKRVVALILAGGLVLTGSPKNVKAEGLDKALSTDEIVQMCEASVTKKLSYEEFCQLSYNAWMYLNDFGVVNVSLDDLYSIVYIINYANIQEEAKDKLKQNTRNYAKRQLTWFRKNTEIKWNTFPEKLKK